MEMKYRLGLDIGTNSIGWAVLELDSNKKVKGIIDAGSRVFSDGRAPKDKTSLAVKRREKRGMRRRRDRLLKRKSRLLNVLVENGLFPHSIKDQQELKNACPYEIRKKAIDTEIDKFELGRALIHLCQRRGFKSNRKEGNRSEQKVIKPKIEALRADLEKYNARTLGEYLLRRKEDKQVVRFKDDVEFYPLRMMYEDEFDVIMSYQKQVHQLDDNFVNQLKEIIFFQRPLKPQDPGRCLFYDKLERAPIALPSYEKFTIAQDLTNLKLVNSETGDIELLTSNQFQLLYKNLTGKKTYKFSKIKKDLKLPEEYEFNLETERRKDLKGAPVKYLLSQSKYFGKAWDEQFGDDDAQDEIVEFVLSSESEEELLQKAINDWKLPNEQAKEVSQLAPEDFPSGYARLSRRALREITDEMLGNRCFYAQATKNLGLSEFDEFEDMEQLPYYGKVIPSSVVGVKSGEIKILEELRRRSDDVADAHLEKIRRKNQTLADELKYGKISNPTVHIGLGQLRKVVNAVISEYGKPAQIVMEFIRDLKLNEEQRRQVSKQQAQNQKDNERVKHELTATNISINHDNILKFKLWEELSQNPNERMCPFSGEQISIAKLFSNDVEIEHILPFSRSLDDSRMNKTLCYSQINREKKNRTPYEAFSSEEKRYAGILLRTKRLPHAKYKRFLKAATDNLKDGFLARQLTDTAYLAKVGKKYLSVICDRDSIWVTPGRITAKVRYLLGLNTLLGIEAYKERTDHRHHAVDAVAIGLMDRGLLKSLSSKYNVNNQQFSLDEPFSNFRDNVKNVIDRIVTSHRANHSINREAHEETNYGAIEPGNQFEKGYNLVSRKFIGGAKIKDIRDERIRNDLIALDGQYKGKELESKIKEYSEKNNVKRVRQLFKNKSAMEITHRQNGCILRKNVIPAQVNYLEVWKIPGQDDKFEVSAINSLEALKKVSKKPHPAAKRLFKIYKGDLFRLNIKGKGRVCSVQSLRPANKNLFFREANDASNDSHPEKFMSLTFNGICKSKMTPAMLGVLGK